MIPPPDVVEVTTLGDLLVRAARRAPHDDAVVFPEVRATYGELLAAATRRARSLVGLGITADDHVGILMPNCMAFVEVLFGIALVGATAVPINARYKHHELGYVIENADLTAVITTDLVGEHVDFATLLHGSLPGLADATDPLHLRLSSAPRLRSVVMIGASAPGGFITEAEFEALADGVDERVIDELRRRVAVRQPAIMMYTSGTTADPKGCPLSHEALVRNGMAMARQRYFLTAEDRLWDPLPMFHMAAILPLTGIFDAGGAFLSMTHVEAGAGLEMMERERATVTYPSFPTLTADLIHHPDFVSRDLSRLRIINNVAPPDTLRQFQAAFPQAVQTSAYGLTEAGGVISWTALDEDLDTRVTTCGTPMAGIQVRVVDPDRGNALRPGEKGEMQVRGYVLFDGYYRDPEKTAEAMTGDGWLRTGDLCSLDAEQRITYHGRIKDMLKVGGENVAAVEVESYLATHPAVKLVQVVGAPDARYGEVPAAFVELKKGATATADDLIEFCRGEIASFKVPRHVRFVSEWPMSTTKIQKFRLREQLAAELDSTQPG